MTADTVTPAPMRPLSVKEALRQVLDDMAALSPEQLRAELDRHQDGPLATALREASSFVATFTPPQPFCVPAGFQLMPVEPTADMLDSLSAGLSEHFGLDASSAEFKRMYRTLLALAPRPTLAATPPASASPSRMDSAPLPAGPAPGTGWQHANGNRYTVLAIANGESTRPDEYPVTVVYRGENGQVWSRPLSRWHASMTPLEQETGGIPAASRSMADTGLAGEGSADALPPLPASTHTAPDGQAGYSSHVLVQFAEAAIAWRLQDYDNFIRALCCALSVGGWNSEGLMPLATADAKIKDGLAMLVEPWRTEVLELRALRLTGAAASGLPPEAVSRIACEWLVTMWEAVAQLENPQAGMEARRQAAQALRLRLEQEPRAHGTPP